MGIVGNAAKGAFNGATSAVGGIVDIAADNLSVATRINKLNMAEADTVVEKIGAAAKGAFNYATFGAAGRLEHKISHADMKAMDDMNTASRDLYLADKRQDAIYKECDNVDSYGNKIAKKADRKGIDISSYKNAVDDPSFGK